MYWGVSVAFLCQFKLWNLNQQDFVLQCFSRVKNQKFVKGKYSTQIISQLIKNLNESTQNIKRITQNNHQEKRLSYFARKGKDQQTELKIGPNGRAKDITCILWRKTSGKVSKKPGTTAQIVKDHKHEQGIPERVEIKRQKDNGVGKVSSKKFLPKPAINNQQNQRVIRKSQGTTCKVKRASSN